MTEDQRKVADIIKDTRIAMLTQVDSSGSLVSRPMATQDVGFDGTVWFICERDTEKVRDLEQNPKVNVAY
ncbi:pyridoxamine 5'-phosphate oxidase family protein, partial [Klebsiella pneumoniae]|nr:pyridoxamine 5'-phosphate oxidase family protein [Klebsiella pneumoniae]